MNILLCHRYYWPDPTPYASMLRSIAEKLTEDGHCVSVLTAQPSYGAGRKMDRRPRLEHQDGVSVYRTRLLSEPPGRNSVRALNLLLFASQLAAHIISPKREIDVVMAATTPPILVGWAVRLASRVRGVKMVYHMQDIYPEVLQANSGRPLNRFLLALRWLDSRTTRHADRTVVLSTDMEETLRRRGARTSNVRIINNFLPDGFTARPTDEALPESPPNLLPGRADRPKLVFAGNLGNFQGLAGVVEAAGLLRPEEQIDLVFIGDGAQRSTLEEQSGDLRGQSIHFVDRVPQASAEELIGAADAGLVTLNPGVIRTAFPSKTLTYLSQGTPLLAVVEATSELGRLIVEHDLGWCVEPADIAGLAKVMAELTNRPEADPMRSRCREFAARYADRTFRLEQWSDLYADLAEEAE